MPLTEKNSNRVFSRVALWMAILILPNLARAEGSTNTSPQVVGSPLINQYFDEALAHYPGLRAAEARVRASQHGVDAIRTWEDPMFKLGGSTASRRGKNLQEEGDLVYGAEQRLPLFGKAALNRKLSEQEHLAARSSANLQQQLLRRELAKALFRTALANRVLEVSELDNRQVTEWTANAEQRYTSGMGSQVEILRLKNESAKRQQERVTRQAELNHEQLTVNRLLHRSLTQSLPPLTLPPAWKEIPYSTALADLATRNEPTLQVLQQETRVAEARTEWTRRQRLPDVTMGIEGRQYSGDGGFREGLFTVGINLPWINRSKYRSDTAREASRAEAAQWDASEYEQKVREEIHNLTVRIDAARREALAYAEDIIPRSEQALTLASVGWISNRGMFVDIMEARRSLLEARLTHARAIAEQYILISELVLCCGLGDLDALEMLRTPNSESHSTTTK